MEENKIETDQSEVEEDKFNLVQFIKNRFRSAKQWKFYYAGGNQTRWIEFIKMYKGRQWKSPETTNKAKVTINLIFPKIQQEIPFMCDKTPKFYINYKEPGDKKASEILESIMDDLFITREMDMKIPESILYAKQTGTSFIMPFWNPELGDGLGDVDCVSIDPLEVFPFSYTKRLNDADGIIHASHVSLGYIHRTYPERGKLVRGGSEDPAIPDRCKETNGETGEVGLAQVTNTTGSRTDYFPSETGGYDEVKWKRILLLKVWFRDEEIEEYEEQQEDGSRKQVEKMKYPNGRIVTTASGIILEDKPYEYTFPPFIEIQNYINGNEFWGEGDVEWLVSPQKWLNKLNSMVADCMSRTVYPTRILYSGSGIDPDNFVVTRDAIYESQVPANQAVSESPPPPSNPQVFDYISKLEEYMQSISGVSEYSAPSSGRLPSGRSLQEFQEVTQIRLRQKIRNMEYSIRMLGKAWLEMILKNYNESRIMRIINPTNRQSEFIYIFREEDPEIAFQIKQQIASQVIPGSEQIDQQTGAPMAGSGTPIYKEILNLAEIKGELDVDVRTGSTVSTSKLASFDQAMTLFQAGVIDQHAVLEAADYPNREEIEKRMSERAQAMQEQQIKTQQEPPPQQQLPIPPKINLSLKGQDLFNPIAQEAIMAGLNGKGTINAQ